MPPYSKSMPRPSGNEHFTRYFISRLASRGSTANQRLKWSSFKLVGFTPVTPSRFGGMPFTPMPHEFGSMVVLESSSVKSVVVVVDSVVDVVVAPVVGSVEVVVVYVIPVVGSVQVVVVPVVASVEVVAELSERQASLRLPATRPFSVSRTAGSCMRPRNW